MDETDLISTLQSHLEANSSVPVRTSGLDDERPIPSIIIEDWDTQDYNFNNSALSGEYYDGTTYEKYLNFSYQTRVELLFRHTDEVDVSRLKEGIVQNLRLLHEHPSNFHSDLKDCLVGRGGSPSFEFREPKEAELMLAVRFEGDHTITVTPSDLGADPINTITETFTFNP